MEMKNLARLMRDNPRNDARGVRIVNAPDAVDVYVYDIIDAWFGISAKDVADALAGVKASTINMHINSPGGDVFEARAIASLLRDQSARIVAHVDGLAASAATTVAMAADEIVMAEGSFLMIHKAWTFGFGNSEDLLKQASILEKIDGEIAKDYAERMGKPLAEVLDIMAAETWYTADEAFLAGLADRVSDAKETASEGAQNAARWNLAAYERVPQALQPKPQQAQQPASSGIIIDIAAMRESNARRLRLIENVAH